MKISKSRKNKLLNFDLNGPLEVLIYRFIEEDVSMADLSIKHFCCYWKGHSAKKPHVVYFVEDITNCCLKRK